jgi:hypothetical protein
MKTLTKLFNWLGDYPRHQYTLDELFNAFRTPSLDNQISGEDGYAPFNRAGRLLERSVTAGSAIGAAFAVATGGLSPLEAAGVVVAGKAVGAMSGAVVATYTSPL